MELIKDIQNPPLILFNILVGIIILCVILILILLLIRLQREKRISMAAMELKKLTNSIRAGLVHFVLEDDCKILYASKGFYELLGYEKQEAKAFTKLTDFLDPGDIGFVQTISEGLKDDMIRCEVRMLHKNGTVIYMMMNGNSSGSKEGKHTIFAVFLDATEQKNMQDRIILESERYRIATELSRAVIFEYDIRNDVLLNSDKFKEWFGRDTVVNDFFKGTESRKSIIHPNDWGIYLELCKDIAEGKSYFSAELRIKNHSGVFIWCQIMGKTIYDDNQKPLRVIGRIINIDSHKRELEALEYKATRDPLTGVYNREVTIKKIDKYISGNKDGVHMLMFVDFDDFKTINDSYGHLAGDKALVFVVNRIKEIFTEGEIIGRIGGDEFVIFSGNIQSVEDVLEKAESLRSALDTIYQDDKGHSIRISGSIGIAVYPEAGHRYEQLIECADQALYKVKEQGKNNFLVYTHST